MTDKKEESSVKDQILQVAAENKATALFIGYTGRKGAKAYLFPLEIWNANNM